MSDVLASSIPISAQAALAAFALLVTLALSIYLLVRRPAPRESTWGVGEIIAVSVLFAITAQLIWWAIDLVGYEVPLSVLSLSITTIGQNVLLVALSFYVVSIRHGLPLTRLGLRFDRWKPRTAMGLIVGGVAMPLAALAERAAEFLLSLGIGKAAAAIQADTELLADPLRPFLQLITAPLSMFWVVLVIGVIVPIGEEVFFRGFVYSGLRARWGVAVGLVGSAVFFAAVHVQLVHGLPIFVVGLLLAVLYERTGSLLPPIVAHALYNVIFVVAVWRGWDV